VNTVLFPNWPAWFVVAVLVFFAVLLLCAAWEWWRARRNEQQLETEIRARRGCKALKRMGWTPEDLQ
jgi:threonine/homoserine efflux transporter RhtA